MVLVSSDADAFEMAQPESWNLASFTASPSMTRQTVYTPSLQVCENVCDVGATDPSPGRISFGIVSQT